MLVLEAILKYGLVPLPISDSFYHYWAQSGHDVGVTLINTYLPQTQRQNPFNSDSLPSSSVTRQLLLPRIFYILSNIIQTADLNNWDLKCHCLSRGKQHMNSVSPLYLRNLHKSSNNHGYMQLFSTYLLKKIQPIKVTHSFKPILLFQKPTVHIIKPHYTISA